MRAGRDPSALQALGAKTAAGDLRDRRSLDAALSGVDTVITTVTSIGRALGGARAATIRDVDDQGNANLVDAAEAVGVNRFAFVSFVIGPALVGAPLAAAKRATEQRLARSRMTPVIVRPERFQGVWISELVGFDWRNGKAQSFGRGETPHAYVAGDDAAEATICLTLDTAEPRDVAFGGPEALTRKQVVERFRSGGPPIAVRPSRGRRCAPAPWRCAGSGRCRRR